MEHTVKMVTIRKLARQTKEVLSDLPCVVTSYGKPIAVLMPYDNRQPTTEVQRMPAPEAGGDSPAVPRDAPSDNKGELASFS
jgi:antitoxin (DNA-binding transcriptional repressor) of toxin-antitoxin stability system